MPYTPESYAKRVMEFMSGDFGDSGYFQFPSRTPDEVAARTITDTERVALTILSKALKEVVHPLVKIWGNRILNDRNYTGFMPRPSEISDAEWRAIYPRTDPEHWKALKLIDDRWTLLYPEPESEPCQTFAESYDNEVRGLCTSIIEHRLKGDEGELIYSSVGFGMWIETSLAAAIAEFHNHVVALCMNLAFLRSRRSLDREKE